MLLNVYQNNKHILNCKSEMKNNFFINQPTVKKEQKKLENQILQEWSTFFHIMVVNSWNANRILGFFRIVSTLVFRFS